MIKELERTKMHIVNWLEEQAKKAGVKALVVGVSGGIDSSLVATLCSLTKYETILVKMPCNSHSNSLNQANELINSLNNVKEFEVDLGDSFGSITNQLDLNLGEDKKKYSEGSLRSRLRAPVLGFIAKAFNGLIVGTGNRSEDSLLRYFDKFGDGAVDISPISRLYKSEVYQLAEYLGVPESIVNAVPTADLWGEEEQTDEAELGMTYDEVEWAERFVEESGMEVRGEFMKLLTLTEKNLTEREKFVLKEVAKHEMNTRHKYNPNLPECVIPTTYLK